MLSYQEYEKAVYDSLLEKRKSDSRFNFSLRQKASKGAEKDYFIGTEKGNYFATTFWNIKVGYPGSAGDLIILLFRISPDLKFKYNFECNQTNNPDNEQNAWALELIKNLEPIFESNIGLSKKSNKRQKIHNYKIKSRKSSYTSFDAMMVDVFKDAEIIIPIVNQEIAKIKTKHPDFIAHQFTNEEFDQMQQKMTARLESADPVKSEKDSDHSAPIPKASESKNISAPLNQIFFGPPGTGKTYNTINDALRIVGIEVEGKTRKELKEEFDKRLQAGQIVFTTFHQSMNYEEFIEGIKPKIVDGEEEEQQLNYQIEPGIFKKLCIEASFELAKSKMSKETEETLDFSILYERFIEKVEEELLNDESVELKTKSGGTVLVDRISPQGNVIIKHPKGSREYIVSKARLTKLNTAFDNLEAVSNINDEFREVIGGSNSSAYWSVLNSIKQINNRVKVKVQEKTYSYTDKLEVVKKMTKEEHRTSKGKNFVLIIDEINRGNVSQIFGELITLIEKDKRLGKDEELKLTLPYSKEKFGVPANLYIIGTMNTADRSVEALDTALRRRFSFTEMPPIYELDELNYEYAGVKGSDILKTINRRIEKLLDRDHLIGHSFFILGENEDPEAKLIQAFYQNLIPLLQEYFYGDYAKIGAVLGNGFVLKQEDFKQTEFASGFNSEVDGERDIYQIIDYREGRPGIHYKQPSMTFEKAVGLLMNQTNRGDR